MDTNEIKLIADICCLLYYLIATIETIPTIIRIIKRKSSSDFSIMSTVMSLIGGTAWTIYIFLTEQSTLVYIGTIWDCVILLIYVFVVFRYHKSK